MREYTPQRAAALTGIPAEDIVALAREYATTRPAAIRLNYGVQRSERGGLAVAPSRSAGADRLVAGSRRRAAAFHVAGVPVQPRRRWSVPDLQQRRSAAKRGS